MLYSKYQKSLIYIFFKKIRFNSKKTILNDLQNLNLKNKINYHKKIILKDGLDKSEQNVIEIKIFNSLGNLVEEHYNDDRILYKLYEYNIKNELTKTTSFKEENEILDEEYYYYNSRNILKSKKVYSDKESYHEFYDYDFNSNLISIDRLYDDSYDLILTYNYYFNGNLREKYMYNGLNLDKQTKFKYSRIGNLNIKETTHLFSSGEVFSKTTEIFNKNGDLETRKMDSFLGEVEKKYIYKYDKNNNWIERLEYTEGNLTEIIKVEIEYFK